MRMLSPFSTLNDRDDLGQEHSHSRSIKDFLPFRHRDLLVVPISEYLEGFLVSHGFEDGHAIGFDGLEAGVFQLLYHFAVHVC